MRHHTFKGRWVKGDGAATCMQARPQVVYYDDVIHRMILSLERRELMFHVVILHNESFCEQAIFVVAVVAGSEQQ